MSINISVGFLSSPDIGGYPGFDTGGIRISIDGSVLTRYNNPYNGFAIYNSSGDPIENDPEEYVGQFLDVNLDRLKNAIIQFKQNDFDRYEELSVKMMEEPGDSTLVLSFCDGKHARIAFQPVSARYGRDFPTEVTVGYAINPDEMCHELADCYRDCVTYVEHVHGDAEMNEPMEEVYDWADGHIEDLLAATSND
jgi:hypothetical protein